MEAAELLEGPERMKSAVTLVCLAAVSALASGCTSISDVMRPGPEEQAQAQQQAYHDLSLPPDLRLPPPGSAPEAAPAPAPAAPAAQVASASPSPYGDAPPAAPEGDIYERNGISKLKPDGTKKTDAELQDELREVYLAKKRQKNPNYGTVLNIGNIFKDE